LEDVLNLSSIKAFPFSSPWSPWFFCSTQDWSSWASGAYLYNDCHCDDRAWNRLLGRGSDHVNLARLFKAGTMSVSALSRSSDGW